MKKLILIGLLLLGTPKVFSQTPGLNGNRYVTDSPSGDCTVGSANQFNILDGSYYGCVKNDPDDMSSAEGTWAVITGGMGDGDSDHASTADTLTTPRNIGGVPFDGSAAISPLATGVVNTPGGNVAATTVQGAVNELDNEKQPLDADLTAIAALACSDGQIAKKASGVWTCAADDNSGGGASIESTTKILIGDNAGNGVALSTPSKCSAGNAARGIDTTGAAADCFDVATQDELDEAVISAGGATFPLSVTRTSSTVLTAGSLCPANVCNVRIGNTVTAISTSATATISSGGGTVLFYVASDGTLTVGYNSAPVVTCSGCTAVSGVTSFPDDSIPIWRWTATSGTWDTSGGTDFRAVLSTSSIVAGTGIIVTYSGGIATVSLDGSVGGASIASTTNLIKGDGFGNGVSSGNPTDCSAGNAARGIDATGAAENCFDVATQAELDAAVISGGGITALTGDGTASGSGSVALTLATVNSNTGACGDATHVCQPTFNAKGLATAASPVAINVTTLTSGATNALKSASTTVDVAAATAPSNGQVLTATDSTHATWQTPSGGSGGSSGGEFLLPGYSYPYAPFTVALTTPVTVNTTTSETSLRGPVFAGNATINAGELSQGRSVHLSISGPLSTHASGSTALTVKIKLGSVVLATYTPTLATGLISTWTLDYTFTVTGYTSLSGGGCLHVNGTSGVVGGICASDTSGVVNFSSDQVLDVTATWTASQSDNSITANSLIARAF